MDNQKTNNKPSNSKRIDQQFVAIVTEVHSGDCLSVKSVKTGQLDRFYLANIRAPQMENPRTGQEGKPFSFESKEYLRRLVIGKQVRVEVEYQRTIPAKQEEGSKDQKLNFVTIFLNEKNVSEQVVEHGFATVNAPFKAEDDCTLYFEQLKEAEKQAQAKKVGLYSEGQKQTHRWNDLTQQKSIQKARQFFSFLDGKKLSGCIDLVLSGTRFKVRLNEHSTYVIVVVNGIKCMQNDQNLPAFAEYSNQALQFSKQNFLQRDVQVEINECDARGSFHGTLFVGKKSVASYLLEAGLAYCDNVRKSVNYGAEYQRLELEAKESKKGLWKEDFNVEEQQQKRNFSLKEVNQSCTAIVSEVISANEFYMQNKNNDKLSNLEKTLSKFNPSSAQPLTKPLKKQTPCVSKFDGGWYRARIENVLSDDKVLVFFVDYGNYDEVQLSNTRQMPKELLSIDAQARKCKLAFLKTPDMDHELGEDAANFFKDLVWEKDLYTQFLFKEDTTYHVTLNNVTKKDDKFCLNGEMIKAGYAKIDKHMKLDERYSNWRVDEENCIEKRVGVWKYDDEDDEY